MSLVSASQLSLAHGPKVLFDRAGFAVGPHDRIGLVGANGTGKSSLLRILAGQLAPDSGELTFRRGARVGYLPQDVGRAARPAARRGGAGLGAGPGRAGAAPGRGRGRRWPRPTATAEQLELSQALAELHEELDHFEEHYGRRRAERILLGLGFAQERLDEPVRTLSGGWRMRAALAGLLLTDPDLLLLDEPTNHLDVPTLTWFDGFLRGARKALVLVSHDREFLNRQIDRVLALEPEGLRAYAGDYDDYRRQRAEEEIRLLAQAERQEAKRAQLERFIERFGAKATKARQAREQGEAARADGGRAGAGAPRHASASSSPTPPRSGREVLRLEGVRKAFGPRVVYRGLDARVQRGERVGVIGSNGAGKTTLLRLVAGDLPPDAGQIALGHGVVTGYYAQHHFERRRARRRRPAAPGSLDPDRTILETLWELVPDRGEAYVRSVAGSFLFSGDDVEKRVGVLSGGERARVALARLLLVPANLLVMDEPTNHLDLDSSEALIEALQEYRGTLLFVSHDRSFLNELATVVWEVKDGGVLPCPGNLDDWLYHQRQLEEAAAARGEQAGGATQLAPRAARSSSGPPIAVGSRPRPATRAPVASGRSGRRSRAWRRASPRWRRRSGRPPPRWPIRRSTRTSPGPGPSSSGRPRRGRSSSTRYVEWEAAQRRLEELREGAG